MRLLGSRWGTPRRSRSCCSCSRSCSVGRPCGRSPMISWLWLSALAAFMLLPLVYMVSSAFKPLDELFLWPPTFVVQRPVWDNFDNLLVATGALQVPFTRYLFNS